MSQPVDGPPGSVDGEEASISTVSSSTVDSSSPINAPGTSANRELLDQSRTHNSSRIHQLCAGSTVYVVLASTLAALGGVLFGYDVGKFVFRLLFRFSLLSPTSYAKARESKLCTSKGCNKGLSLQTTSSKIIITGVY